MTTDRAPRAENPPSGAGPTKEVIEMNRLSLALFAESAAFAVVGVISYLAKAIPLFLLAVVFLPAVIVSGAMSVYARRHAIEMAFRAGPIAHDGR